MAGEIYINPKPSVRNSAGRPQIINMKRMHWIFSAYMVTAVAMLLFTYTQVDLNLTLSRASLIQTFQKAFQYVGYYQRPTATLLYVAIVFLLFGLYGVLLNGIKKGNIQPRNVWKLIIVVACILVFSYPAAFSYDFFNYLFTAKTVLVYHQNPYTVTPLQFSGIDPWTNFMRWTHLTSAYTPFWIGLSLAPYLAGLGYFVLVLFSMKFMIAGFYLLACRALWYAMDTEESKQKMYGLALFAFNPLILIESLVSGHNDIVLAAFALLAIGMYMKKRYIAAWILLSLSVASKFMTIFLIPVFLLKRGKEWMLTAMLLGLSLVLLRREFLPWYWVWVMPFIALNYQYRKLMVFAAIVSFGLVASYAPYLYFGEYSVPEQIWKTSIIWMCVGVSFLSLLFPGRNHGKTPPVS